MLVAGGNTTVGGNYTQASSGTLSISLGSHAQRHRHGQPGRHLNIAGKDAGYVTNSHQDLLTAGGGRQRHLRQRSPCPAACSCRSTLQYDANDVWIDTTCLSITGTATTAGFSAQPAVMGSAQRVDGAFEQINQRMASRASAHGVRPVS